ncbi:hypothetical protein Clacol_008919 [Clathrus columnatus]|uniref:AMP-dependent synthetase/ligase domain-containing protein n=1 Tax=Clathrus columnatus TaxID=1419009 RepID=A0AAV5APP4_9AGAM|nr:hypothetical protein Clacol_008919 [Clathrus columnatus]
MEPLSPFVTALEEAATAYPEKVAFKLPVLKDKKIIQGWRDITYKQTHDKMVGVARYWLKTLQLPPRSVVGLWLPGNSFSDMLHIFGIMKAGYIPHILLSDITNLEVVRALFKDTDCGAILYTPSASGEGLSKDFVCHPIMDTEEIEISEDSSIVIPFDSESVLNEGDTVVIVHTSGSTSGRPKIVHIRQKWFEANHHKSIMRKPRSPVIPRLGTFSHIGQLGAFLLYFTETVCLVMLPWLDYSAQDIIQMYKECGLSHFLQYAPALSRTIRAAQQNPELRAILQTFPVLFYLGTSLPESDIEWCKQNDIRLKTALALTETGSLMVQSGDDPNILHIIKAEGCSYKMVPVDADLDTSSDNSVTQSRLLELVVLSDSMDCPDPSHCDPVDGNFHTKDLFEEINPGEYKYRGRHDDIMQMANSSKCDTKYIEERVYTLCRDLVSTCVVVGTQKPAPALVVEHMPVNLTEKELIQQLSERLASINEGGYTHERIASGRILVVSPGELPRTSTKRNVIREATEIKFRNQINALYA